MTSAGYSGTPLPKKLGIKEGSLVGLSGAPPGFEKTLGRLPSGAAVRSRACGPFDVLVLFTTKASELHKRLPGLKEKLDFAGGLWVAWPKKASGVATDIDFQVVQSAGLGVGLVDNKVAAVDDTWSGLRFVYRKTDRPR